MTKIGFQRGYITDAEIIKYTDKIIPTSSAEKIFDFENYTLNHVDE
jgi:hypothetical protein